jgi:hypothetical protein
MSALHLLQRGHVGFESRNLARRAHRIDLYTEPLERRQLLSTGHAADAAIVVANPTAAAQTNLPTNNSSSTNAPGVSPMTPSPVNVTTDDSASVTTSASAAISALNPDMTSALDAASDAPVYLVEMPVPSTTIELSIETPGLLQSIDSPTNLQSIDSPTNLQSINSPVILHPINAPVGVQATNTPMPAPNAPPTVIQHIGQSIGTDIQTRFGAHVGPEPDEGTWIEGLEPLKPFEPAQPPKAEPPGIELPKGDPPIDQAPPVKQPLPAQEAPPVTAPRVPQPADGGAEPAAPGATPPQTVSLSIKAPTTASQLFGVAAVIGGGFHLAMGESERFGTRSLPCRTPIPRPARPRMLRR